MRKLFFLLLFILAAVGASARQDTLKYRISLKDKAATTYSLEHPEAFLSEKAIERRRKQNLPIDSTDLPVCRKYVDEIRRQGVKIVVTGKWENFVTVSCNDSALVERIAALPFVRETEKVWIAPGGDGPFMATGRDSLINHIASMSCPGVTCRPSKQSTRLPSTPMFSTIIPPSSGR